MSGLCGCQSCVQDRALAAATGCGGYVMIQTTPGWRYACDLCGNKRCPHHTDHRLACTDSNEPGQSGSSWA